MKKAIWNIVCVSLLVVMLLVLQGCVDAFFGFLKLEIPDQDIVGGDVLKLELNTFVTGNSVGNLSYEILAGVGDIEGDVFTFIPGVKGSGEYLTEVLVRDSR